MSHHDKDSHEESGAWLAAAVERLPRELEPPHDLWPEIAARLSPRARPRRSLAGRAGNWMLRGGWQALAAVLLLTFGILLGRMTTPRPATAPTTAALTASFAAAEAEYLRAREALYASARERRNDLPPASREVLERNLRIIDQAIRELRTALAEDPQNPQLESFLLARYRSEIDLLQELAGAATES